MSSTNTVACPSCQAVLKLPANIPAGRRPKCPKCNQPIPLSAITPVEATDRPSTPSDPTSSSKQSVALGSASSNPASGSTSQATRKADPPAPGGKYDYLAPPEQPDELGRLGPYRVLEELGAGGMGVVFKAEDPSLRRVLALKVMLPHVAKNATARTRFLREARAQAAVEHDHVISIHVVGEDRGMPYLAMPMLKGQTLSALLKTTPRLPLPDLLRIIRETAEGLSAAHEKGLVHRDIKPANIWLEGTKQRVKILDFGLARATTEGEGGEEPVTKAGAAVGTPAYMSPEQARGLPVDHRTDLFSLGVLAYQLATGEIPFRGHDVMSVLRSLALEPAVPPMERNPEIPQAVNDLILRMLGKNPDERPASGEEVAEAIRQIEASFYRPTVAVTPSQPVEAFMPPPSYAAPAFEAPAGANPWADIDATDTGLLPPAPPAAAASTRNLPATPAAPPAAVPATPAERNAPTSPRTSRQPAPPKRKSALIFITVGVVLSIALLGGLAWFAIQTASGPQGTIDVVLDPEVPEVTVIVRQGNDQYTLKPGPTKVRVGEYTVEVTPEFAKTYRASPIRTTVVENDRSEVKVRPIKPRPKSPS